MQRLLFPLRISEEVVRSRAPRPIDDDHRLYFVWSASDHYIVMTCSVELNLKRQWNIYNAIPTGDGVVIISDGLEFRADRKAADREYNRRIEADRER